MSSLHFSCAFMAGMHAISARRSHMMIGNVDKTSESGNNRLIDPSANDMLTSGRILYVHTAVRTSQRGSNMTLFTLNEPGGRKEHTHTDTHTDFNSNSKVLLSYAQSYCVEMAMKLF